MKVNDIVKFTETLEPNDEHIRMRVLEVSGLRVKVEALVGMSINPTYVYHIEDVTLV